MMEHRGSLRCQESQPCTVLLPASSEGKGPALQTSQACPEPKNPPCPGGSRLETVCAAFHLPLLPLPGLHLPTPAHPSPPGAPSPLSILHHPPGGLHPPAAVPALPPPRPLLAARVLPHSRPVAGPRGSLPAGWVGRARRGESGDGERRLGAGCW